jgi:putative pre-16S rRNA nuclease
MQYLAIDYGLAHIGLAISDGALAEPYKQLKYISDEQVVDQISNICQQNQVEKVVLGLSENQMAIKIKEFASKLRQKIGDKIILHDETLSSQMAQNMLVESGVKKKKRQEKQHQTAAAIILQSYLDSLDKMPI